MKRTRVVNCTKEDYDIYIGRGTLTPVDTGIWGNPFKVGRDGTREEVVDKYWKWVITQPKILNLLPTLKGKRLGCWCAPKPCHGDILVELVEGVFQKTLF